MSTVELAYDSQGEGPALVLLHAFPCSGQMWVAQRAALAADGWRVVTPDLRGFGASPLGSDSPSLDRMADDVLAVLDRLGVDRCVLGGLSMGGYVAMALLRRRPEVVAGLVLADTKATADPPAAVANRERIAASVSAAGSAGDVLRESVVPALLGATTVATRPDVVATVDRFVAAASADAVAWAQRAMAARPDSLPTLADTHVPALVVWGDEDALSPRPDAEAMLAALPRGTGVELPGSGHLTALEVPEALSGTIRDFARPLRGPFV
jgi:pimeloyl-ACP methyl ester carboxylesterase